MYTGMLLAIVRRRGAIGAFYPEQFEVTGETRADCERDWFRRYTVTWELHHFVWPDTEHCCSRWVPHWWESGQPGGPWGDKGEEP